jgi:hypothetical protein
MFFLPKYSESVTLSPIWEGSVKSGALSPTPIAVEHHRIFYKTRKTYYAFAHNNRIEKEIPQKVAVEVV